MRFSVDVVEEKENVLPPVTLQGTLSPVTVDDSPLLSSPFRQPQQNKYIFSSISPRFLSPSIITYLIL